jgi:hypothetical protein
VSNCSRNNEYLGFLWEIYFSNYTCMQIIYNKPEKYFLISDEMLYIQNILFTILVVWFKT